MMSAPNLARAQRRGRVGGKIGIAGAGDENDDAAQLEMADRAAEDERLGHVFHFDRRLHAGFDADLTSALCSARPLITVASMPM